MPLFQQGHALLIGVSEYRDARLRLSGPITFADAQGVANALKDGAIAAYPPGQVSLLPDQGRRATRDEVARAFEELAGRLKPDDTAFVFFCGHGVLDENGEYCLTTEDSVLTAGGRVKPGTALAKTRLMELMRAVKARKVLFVINACFSGHVGGTLGAQEAALGAPPSATLGAEILGTGEGRALLTASRPSQYSYFIDKDNNTYFGQALIDGLRGQATGHGGYIGLYELYLYVHAAVRSRASGRQEPVLSIVDGIGPFPVALHKGGSLAALNPAAIDQHPPRGAVVDVVNRNVVAASGLRSQAVNAQAHGNLVLDQSRKAIDFGSGNNIGSVTIGDVAGGNITKTTVTITTAAAAQANDVGAVLNAVGSIREDLAKLQVPDDAEGIREDADGELEKAGKAGRKGDKARLKEKLESAEKFLLRLGSVAADGIKLAEAVGVLLQRLAGT